MTVLMVLFGMEDSKTAFRLAEEMAGDGDRVVFLFAGEGCRHAFDQTIMEVRRFAEGIYVLKDSLGRCPHDSLPEGVRVIDYVGWVRLLEDCDRVVSWT